MKYWQKEEENFLKQNIELPLKIIVESFNKTFSPRSKNSIQKKHKKIKNNFRFSDIKKLINLELTKDGFSEYINQWIIETSQNFTFKNFVTPVNSNKVSLVLSLSDWHFGKKTENFNLEIAKNRISCLPAKLLEQKIIANLRKEKQIDEIVLLDMGDNVEGEDIFSTQNGKIESPVIHQYIHVVESKIQLMKDLESIFQCQVREECVPGNHGRMSKTANEESNWDNVVYQTMYKIIELSNNKNIKINLNFKNFKKINIKGHIGLINHQGVKHQGTPAMQIKTGGWIITKDIEFTCSGHNHQYSNEFFLGHPVLKNGSLCGGDDLSEQMGKAEPPRQGFFLVEKNKPISVFGFIQWDE